MHLLETIAGGVILKIAAAPAAVQQLGSTLEMSAISIRTIVRDTKRKRLLLTLPQTVLSS